MLFSLHFSVNRHHIDPVFLLDSLLCLMCRSYRKDVSIAPGNLCVSFCHSRLVDAINNSVNLASYRLTRR